MKNRIYNYATVTPPPEILGLIAGDFLQNLRSVFDYLVWQLIVANGKIPHETKTAFPVCKDATTFEKAKASRLVGVPQASGGTYRVKSRWIIRENSLTPCAFSYRI